MTHETKNGASSVYFLTVGCSAVRQFGITVCTVSDLLRGNVSVFSAELTKTCARPRSMSIAARHPGNGIHASSSFQLLGLYSSGEAPALMRDGDRRKINLRKKIDAGLITRTPDYHQDAMILVAKHDAYNKLR